MPTLFYMTYHLLFFHFFGWNQSKNIKKVRNQPKKDDFEVPPKGVDQFFVHFHTFFVDCSLEITGKGLKWPKMVETGWKKVFWPAFKCCKHLKAGQNTQHLVSLSFQRNGNTVGVDIQNPDYSGFQMVPMRLVLKWSGFKCTLQNRMFWQ